MQPHPVNVYIVISELEREIFDNVKRKEAMASEMASELIQRIKVYEKEELKLEQESLDEYYSPKQNIVIPQWIRS